MRILVIQRWTTDLDPLEQALHDAGLDAAITRIDFIAALDAALAHERFDLLVYDPSTPEVSRAALEDSLRHHGGQLRVAVLEDVRMIGEQVASLLALRRN
ncbi:MAG TPA: hypothetical protein VL326_25865 [Kofleriaceae bacterium]|nr:hypothetical protein [Kofleriaceae bacterium]